MERLFAAACTTGGSDFFCSALRATERLRGGGLDGARKTIAIKKPTDY